MCSLLTDKLFVNESTLTVQTELDTANTSDLRGGKCRSRSSLVSRVSVRQGARGAARARARAVSACTRGRRPAPGREAPRCWSCPPATGSSRAPRPGPPPPLHSPTGLTVVELE